MGEHYTADSPQDGLAPNVDGAAEPSIDGTASTEVQTNESRTSEAPDHNNQAEIAIDNVPFSVWTPTEKKLIIFSAGVAAFFSPVSGQIYFPALNSIAADLNVSYSLVNLSITTYMIMQGLAPAFIGRLSDDAGRRPAYALCLIIYVVANIGLALQNSYPALMVLRCLQSAGSSGTVALASAVVADIVTSSERGIYVSYTSVAPQVGPSLGPIIGGLLAQYVGWHFIFWFLVILAGVVSVPMALFFPETCRKVVGDGSIPPVKWSRCYTNYINENRAVKMGKTIPWEKRDELARKRHIRVPNPFSVLTIIAQKSCGYPLFYTALVCSGVYATAALIPSQFGTIYNFNELQIALCYIPLGAGSMLAAFVRGRMIDAQFRYHAKRLNMPIVHNRRADLTNFPIERARLEVAVPTLFLGSTCIIGFGWTVQYKTNLAGPLILLFVIGFCVSATINTVAVLIIDINPDKAGTATAANNLLRCWLGAGAVSIIIPMIDAIGVGWTCTFLGLVTIAFSPILWYVMKNGPRWRREGREKAEQKKTEMEAEANVGGEKGSNGGVVA